MASEYEPYEAVDTRFGVTSYLTPGEAELIVLGGITIDTDRTYWEAVSVLRRNR